MKNSNWNKLMWHIKEMQEIRDAKWAKGKDGDMIFIKRESK